MRVLMINSVCGIRSTGRICTDLAEEFLAEGHEVRIAYGRESVPDKYKDISVRIGSNIDIYIAVMKSRLLDNEGFNNIRATKEFLKWADEYNPDLLWLHNLHGYYINLELLFVWIRSRLNMQVKWTLHDCWSFTGHCSYFTVAKCDKWKEQCINCPQRNEYPTSVWLDNSEKNYIRKKELFTSVKDMILITPSKWLAELVKDSFLNEYKTEVHNNKIDRTVFKPTQGDFRKIYNLENKKIVLGVASAWSNSKGLEDFNKLADMLAEDYVIVLVGLTKKQIKNVNPQILCIERTNSVKELAEIYTTADLFVNLTHQDNYPTVNLEARACGTKVITYDVGGSPESAGYQYVVEENDIEGIRKLIFQICAFDNTVKSMR